MIQTQKIKSTNLEKCKDKLRKLYGLYPYDTASNPTYGDWLFSLSIENDFDKATIVKAKKKLKIKD